MSGGGAAGRAGQDELQEAISAHASSEQTDEYSDDFETDEDGMLNGIEEELTESNSGAASTEKSVAVESLLLNDDASQNPVDLENEAAVDLTLSFHEKKLQQIMVLEAENTQDDRKDGEEECLEGQNEDQDQKTVSTSDLKLEDNGRKSPSVVEQMMTTVCEKTKELENPTAHSSDGTVTIAEGQIITDTMQEKPNERKERVLQNSKASASDWSPSSVNLKKKAKAVPSAAPVSSRYLGTLKVLEEDKCMQKKRTEFDKADSLRAAVFQAFKKWKERKVEHLREQSRKEKQSERMRKKKEEELIAEKRIVSISAVEKWNEKKEEYIKKKKVEKFLERKKHEMQQVQKEEKNEKAMEEYERWLERKERREQLEKKQRKLQDVHGNEMSPPWRPPGKVTYSGNY
ncbi:microtubule associated protein 9 [Willisornis vidua]|uniref:Microtubule associated protein 9 n=1 Tax=Willisornis vidua TaxID=1566151 RepID=A0ABQ9CU27_9PASS|nr:microtubule associated protein 9 [Willisornis vidua]